MKTTLCFFFVAVSFSSCLNVANNNDLVSARWVFSKTDAADIRKSADQTEYYYGTDGFEQAFAASKFIIRPDNTFDLNLFQNYRHGKWEHKDRFLILCVEPFKDSIYLTIDTVAYRSMQLTIDTINFRKLGRMIKPEGIHSLFADKDEIHFLFKLDKETYKDEDEDPYSKTNNKWRIKPATSETPDEIKKRVLNLVDFYMLMYEDAWSRNKGMVLYTWFNAPLFVTNDVIALKKYEEVQADWEDYFYNPQEAMQAYRLLESGFTKKIKANKEIESKFLRNKDLLEQFKKNIQ
jgi:hypothetical protein